MVLSRGQLSPPGTLGNVKNFCLSCWENGKLATGISWVGLRDAAILVHLPIYRTDPTERLIWPQMSDMLWMRCRPRAGRCSPAMWQEYTLFRQEIMNEKYPQNSIVYSNGKPWVWAQCWHGGRCGVVFGERLKSSWVKWVNHTCLKGSVGKGEDQGRPGVRWRWGEAGRGHQLSSSAGHDHDRVAR